MVAGEVCDVDYWVILEQYQRALVFDDSLDVWLEHLHILECIFLEIGQLYVFELFKLLDWNKVSVVDLVAHHVVHDVRLEGFTALREENEVVNAHKALSQ